MEWSMQKETPLFDVSMLYNTIMPFDGAQSRLFNKARINATAYE